MLKLLIPGLMGLMFLVGCGAKTESESKSETDAPKAELGEVTTGDPGTSMLDDLANDDPSSTDNDENSNDDQNADPQPKQPTPDSKDDGGPADNDANSKTTASDTEPFIEIDKEEEDE